MDNETMSPGPRLGIDEADVKFLIEKNADGIIVVDTEGVVMFANPAAERIFGRHAHALVGTQIGIPLSADETTEISVFKPQGTQADVEVRCVDTHWNRRNARLASLRDISQRKAQEEQLRHATKMEAVGRLTAGIAHDFNNLLTVVLGNLDGAQRLLEDADPAVRRSITNAVHGARRAAVLTERLLTFARRKPLEPCLLDVGALMERIADLLRRSLGEDLQVKTLLADRLANVEVDPTELETSVLNLAVNARDAMPSGGELTIATMNVDIDAAAARAGEISPGRYVLIQVTDTGSGMSPSTLKLAFEPFFSTKSHNGGTGLGLSQVYGFVRQSGGRVDLASEPGRGTTVKILLPAAVDGAAVVRREPPEVPSDHIARGSPDQLILVVEDHAEVRSYAVASLSGLGYGVIEAGDAIAALEILEREPAISLLFTDLGLPGGVDGKMLAERARQLRPTLPVLITSGYAGDDLNASGQLDGNFELLSKPFTLPTLAKRIHELFARSRPQASTARPAHVLVIEDEPLVRMYVTDILSEGGIQSEEAETFSAALSALSTIKSLSAAIIDLTLPDRSGVQIVSEIRRLRPQLPIVVASGRAEAELRGQFHEDAQLRVLSKPFDRDALINALAAIGLPYRQQE